MLEIILEREIIYGQKKKKISHCGKLNKLQLFGSSNKSSKLDTLKLMKKFISCVHA